MRGRQRTAKCGGSKWGLALALIAIAVLVGQVLSLGEETDWSGLIEQAKSAVVWILAETSEGTSKGSGALISPNGYILTAAHVIEGASKITVVVEESREYRATITKADYDMDVALLKISASGLTWLALGDSDKARYDQDVRAMGYPWPGAGRGFVATAAKIEGFRSRGTIQLIQFTAVVNPGNSGGPLINEFGEIIGVVSELWSQALSPEAPPIPFALAVAINSAKGIIPYGVQPSGPSPVHPPTSPGVSTGPIRVPQDYPNLATAVRAAPENAEIKVSRGTYQGNVTITKPLSIVGEEGAIIAGTLKIRGAQNVNLESFEVHGGVEIYDSSSLILDGLTVQQSPGVGITMEGSSVSIANCTIEDCAGAGIDASFGTRLTLRENRILRNGGDGVALSFGSQARITGNTIIENDGYGISASSDITIIGDHNLGWANSQGPASEAVPEIVSPCIRVPEDFELEDAVAKVPTGSSGTLILIAPGTHLANIEIAASLTLRGTTEQFEKPCIEGVSNETVVGVVGDAVVSIENLKITGGWHGIGIQNAARVTIRDCSISDNEATGLSATHSTQVNIRDSTVSSNGNNGLSIWAEAQVELIGCQILDNMQHGIVAERQARFTLEDSAVTGNQKAGLFVKDTAQAIIHDSTLAGNEDGILVLGSAQVTVKGSLISENACRGLEISGSSGVIVSKCVIQSNGHQCPSALSPGANGITVEDIAMVTLEESRISTNAGSGITVGDLAHVIFRGCTVSGNERAGLWVSDSAMVTLTDSTVSATRGYGLIMRSGEAQVTLQDCAISGHSVGLYAGGSTQVVVRDSTISDSKFSGLDVRDSAEVTLQDSTVSDNQDGLFVAGQAKIHIYSSCFLNNRRYWIFHGGSSDVRIDGTDIELKGNGADLGGFAPPSLRQPLAAQTDRIELSVPGDYLTVQEAIDAIAPGGTITVARGTFTGGLTIWKPVAIQGAGPDETVLKPLPGREVVISILPCAERVNLAGLKVRGSAEDGVVVWGGEVTVENCCIAENAENGLSIEGSAQVEVRDNLFLDNGSSAVYGGSAKAVISGANNRMLGNGVVVAGHAPRSLWSPSVPPTNATELSVPGDYSSLQEAIDAIAPEGTITISPGRFTGGLTVWKPVTIQGAGQNMTTLIPHFESRGTIEVLPWEEPGRLALKDLTISGFSKGMSIGGGETAFVGVRVSVAGVGILATGSAQVSLDRCIVSTTGVWGEGLLVLDAAALTLDHSTVSNNCIGLFVMDSAMAHLLNSTVSDNREYGVWVTDLARATIRNSCILNNGMDGILLNRQAVVQIEANQILRNTGYGIKCYEFTTVTGSGNTIPGPDEPDGNTKGALNPEYPGAPWPEGFLKE